MGNKQIRLEKRDRTETKKRPTRSKRNQKDFVDKVLEKILDKFLEEHNDEPNLLTNF